MDMINYENGAQYVISTIHKRDPLSIVSEVFINCNELIETHRQNFENVKNFELRFSAQLSRLNAHGTAGIHYWHCFCCQMLIWMIVNLSQLCCLRS